MSFTVLTRRWLSQDGAVTTEYALVAVLIGIALLATLELVGGSLSALYDVVTERVVGAEPE